jgi:hypothetical protein
MEGLSPVACDAEKKKKKNALKTPPPPSPLPPWTLPRKVYEYQSAMTGLAVRSERHQLRFTSWLFLLALIVVLGLSLVKWMRALSRVGRKDQQALTGEKREWKNARRRQHRK